MFLQMIGSRNTVPPRMFRMVPFGLFHIFFRLNSVDVRNIQMEDFNMQTWLMDISHDTYITKMNMNIFR